MKPAAKLSLLHDLHADFLRSPPTPAEATRVLRDYERTAAEVEKLDEQCAAASVQITALGGKRKAAADTRTSSWHLALKLADEPRKQKQALAALRDYQRSGARLKELDQQCLKKYRAMVALGEKRKAKRVERDDLARLLVRSFGNGPLVIGGVTHDFGLSGERVYLVARKPRSK